jgi:hypothetical protein
VDAVGLKVVGETLVGMVVGVDDGDDDGYALGKVLALTVGGIVLVGEDEGEGVVRVVGKALTDGDWVGHPSPNRIEVSEVSKSPPSAMIPSS